MPSRGSHHERDWSGLRAGAREWKPVSTGDGAAAAAQAAAPTAPAVRDGAADAAYPHQCPPTAGGAAAATGAPPASAREAGQCAASPSADGRGRFLTDSQITRGSEKQRELKRFDFAAWGDGKDNGALEELGGGERKKSEKWDQFKVNEEKFGVVSTFKADLSQYTTVLDKRKVSKEIKQKAERIAHELERGGACTARDEEYFDGDGEADEEDLFSAVSRGRLPSGVTAVWQPVQRPKQAKSPRQVNSENEEAGRALLASLRAAPAGESDHRSLVTPKVQEWWRSRRSAGASIPPDAEVALVCPFSQRVFGDVSQLMTHWAGALSRAVDPEGSAETPSETASQHFARMAQDLRWSQMASDSRLDVAYPIGEPKPGSVWEQIVGRLSAESGSGDSGEGPTVTAERPVVDFVVEAVRLKCWRREQKIEHREVLEGMAAGLAICALAEPLVGLRVPWETEGSGGGSGLIDSMDAAQARKLNGERVRDEASRNTQQAIQSRLAMSLASRGSWS